MLSSIGTRIFLCDLFDSVENLLGVYVEKDFTYYDDNPVFVLHSYVQLNTAQIMERLYEYYGASGFKLYTAVGIHSILLEGKVLLWQRESGIALNVEIPG